MFPYVSSSSAALHFQIILALDTCHLTSSASEVFSARATTNTSSSIEASLKGSWEDFHFFAIGSLLLELQHWTMKMQSQSEHFSPLTESPNGDGDPKSLSIDNATNTLVLPVSCTWVVRWRSRRSKAIVTSGPEVVFTASNRITRARLRALGTDHNYLLLGYVQYKRGK
jgi:hypothetical protein